jgi:hypothetical protein
MTKIHQKQKKLTCVEAAMTAASPIIDAPVHTVDIPNVKMNCDGKLEKKATELWRAVAARKQNRSTKRWEPRRSANAAAMLPAGAEIQGFNAANKPICDGVKPRFRE